MSQQERDDAVLQRSEDVLEARHKELVTRAAGFPPILTVALVLYLVVASVASYLQYQDLHNVASDTNRRVTVEVAQKDRTIERLEVRIDDLETTLDDAMHVQEQLTYWLTDLIDRAQLAGIELPKILIGPQYPIPGQPAE